MQFVLAVALSQLGKPYVWGKSHPLEGFDCSGFIQYVLDSAGIGPSVDMNAQGLYDYYSAAPGSQVGVIKTGALAFYGMDLKHITHVAFMIDHYRIIEAAGGDHTFVLIDSSQQSAKKAGVRVRPYRKRKDFLTTVYPSYATIGLAI